MIAVLIPTLNRSERLGSILANLREVASVPYTAYFIAEETDEATCATLSQLVPEHVAIVGKFGSSPKAMNAGFAASTEPFVFTGNDDMLWHPGWDREALKAFGHPLTGPKIVGTNDGHGRMTCFAVARRAYIEEHSGVYDAPARLWHTYRSQYCDTELADYAKARGVWGEAPESITEHLHPDFGKADPNHPNHLKARAACAADHATYLERKPLWEAAAERNPE